MLRRLLTPVCGALDAYLLVLLGAAAHGRRRRPPPAGPPLRFVVLVPARDEEASIATTLASLRRLDHPAGRWEAIVIADNCRDRTHAVAVQAGATVWERMGGPEGGKGAALAWALDRLLDERPEADAVVLVDADCAVTPNLLAAVQARLHAGAAAVQVPYGVANPEASWATALRYASLALINDVRPLGKATLGLSAGLLGTGMGFSRPLLERHPWTAVSLVEDQEHHLGLVAAGVRVAFAHEAAVDSPMPAGLRRSRAQQLRWDAGRSRLMRTWTPRLLAQGIRRRDAAQVHAALELLVPPQSVLLVANLAAATAARTRRRALAPLAMHAGFVVGGLALVRAPAPVWRALARAPVLAAWKLGLLARLWVGRGPSSWERTAREGDPASGAGAPGDAAQLVAAQVGP